MLTDLLQLFSQRRYQSKERNSMILKMMVEDEIYDMRNNNEDEEKYKPPSLSAVSAHQ